jgi:uncharacterized protein (TIGR03435 family)
LATVYEISDARIDLPLALDDEDGVYSVVLMMAPGEEGGTLSEPMQAGLARYFRFNVTRQIVSTPALIMTAPDGALRAKRLSEHSGGGVMGISTETIDVMSKGDGPRPISALSGDMSIESLCHALENWLGQPVIDETRIEGTFHIEVRSDVATNEGFLDALRTQTGLALTPGERDVPTLIVRST